MATQDGCHLEAAETLREVAAPSTRALDARAITQAIGAKQ
jgi:hypothetical protein